jgi:site-specific recombinase XerD
MNYEKRPRLKASGSAFSGRHIPPKKGVRKMDFMEEYREARLKEYTEYYRAKGYTSSTLDERGRAVRHLLEYLGEAGIDRIEDIDTKVLEGFREFLFRRAERLNIPLKKATLKLKMESARHFLTFLREQKDVTARALLKFEEEKAMKREAEIPAAFRDAFNSFMEQKRREETPARTLELFRYGLKYFFRYLVEERHIQSLSEIKREDIKDFTGYLIDWTSKIGKNKGRPLSMSSINKHVDALRHFLKWAAKAGGAPHNLPNCYNLFTAIHRMKESDKVSRNIFTRKEITALFNRKAERPYEFMMKTIFTVLYSSGLRCGELLALKLSDIDFEKKEAVVYESKTKKERIVQLGEIGTAYLRLYLEHVRPLIGHRRNETEEQEQIVFVSDKERVTPCIHTVNDYLKDFCAKAGIKKVVSSHCFRHSYGTHILENGAGIKEVADLLGHDSIETTQNYTRLAPERLRETLLKFHPREKA